MTTLLNIRDFLEHRCRQVDTLREQLNADDCTEMERTDILYNIRVHCNVISAYIKQLPEEDRQQYAEYAVFEQNTIPNQSK